VRGRSGVLRRAIPVVSFCAASAAVVIILSVKAGPPTPAVRLAAGQSSQLPAPSESSVGADASSAVTAWVQFQAAPDILVRAESAKELRGLMTLEECADNKDIVTPLGQRLRVKYVWCKDDGRVDREGEPGGPANPSQEHAAVFELVVPETRAYYPWARVWWEDSCGDSIIVLLTPEGGETKEFVVQDGTLQWWHWVPVAGQGGLLLQQGTYRLLVKNREDGARLSSILFCTKRYEVYKPETPEG